eukprot:3913993-Pyramimonas_sp.AAC.1
MRGVSYLRQGLPWCANFQAALATRCASFSRSCSSTPMLAKSMSRLRASRSMRLGMATARRARQWSRSQNAPSGARKHCGSCT